MSIFVHCDSCGKNIDAPDSASGKKAKCPNCGGQINIPSLKDDDELKLAPLDYEEEARRNQLLVETTRLRENILKETNIPEEQVQAEQTSSEEPTPTLNDKDLNEAIVTYLRLMADGELDKAEHSAAYIIPAGQKAKDLLEQIALAEIPSERLANIPQQVLAGLIKNLRNKIG